MSFFGFLCILSLALTSTSAEARDNQHTSMTSSEEKTVMADPQAGFPFGPLRVSKRNPRYFEDAQGRVLFLTGSHAACDMTDESPTDPPEVFDYSAFLDFLQRNHHNLIRLWTCHQPKHSWSHPTLVVYDSPVPWQRTGPGNALDGKPKFDLTRFNPEYFTRLRERAIAAGRRGMYVSVMLFEGDALHYAAKPWCWDGHPFNVSNNINGLDGDPEKTGRGLKLLSLDIPAVTSYQEAYVRKVIDTVGDLDNVLYEIANESGRGSLRWQEHMIRFVHDYEAARPKKHPVGMTFAFGMPEIGGSCTNEEMFQSAAEWISPAVAPEPYVTDPPAADGRKVLIPDTDHLEGRTPENMLPWVWKSFCRGMNILLMDDVCLTPDEPWRNAVRRDMGACRQYSERMNLAEAVPCDDLASTKYCLSDKKSHFLVFLPEGPAVEVALTHAPGVFNVEWRNMKTGEVASGGTINGGEKAQLTSPFIGPSVLYLWKKQ
jgi:hypothetical protein